jgi:hypothetical protein
LVSPPARNRGLGQSTSFQIHTEEVGNGEDLRAGGAFTSDAYLAAHQIAVATAPVSKESLIARWALVHSLIDKSLRLTQSVGKPGLRWLVCLTVTESESALATG